MYDKEARHVIEALRSGVPSRTVGQYFTEARHDLMKAVSGQLEKVHDTGDSRGFVVRGRYGEGKTHLLNTVFNMAHQNNMVVSMISIGKDAPLDKLHVIYPQIVNNTYLPGHEQPGFLDELQKLTSGSQEATELQLFATRELVCDKLYYVIRTYVNTDDSDVRYQLRSDLEGDFISTPVIKKLYKEKCKETARLNVNFSKTKHAADYFAFLSQMFRSMGYDGWVILFDEAELIGRFGKKARMNSYKNMSYFLNPPSSLKSTLSIFTLTASYVDEVIDKKKDLEVVEQVFGEEAEPARNAIQSILRSATLTSMTNEEIQQILNRILDFHSKAYDWTPNVTIDQLMHVVESSGYLLRTKLRATIEYLDQMFQYGQETKTTVGSLQDISFEGEDVPSLDDLDSDEA